MIEMKVDYDVGPLENLKKTLLAKLQIAVEETAFAVEYNAKIHCPVDTGALSASIYTVTTNHPQRYELAINAAMEHYWSPGKRTWRKGGPEKYPLPKSPFVGAAPNKLTAYVATGMSYGYHVEFGTLSTPSQPFMQPAVELERVTFEKNVRNAISGATDDAGFD